MTMAEDLMFSPAGELAAAVSAGDLSARELVEASYDAIGRLNGELNAFVTLCEERPSPRRTPWSAATTARWPACRSRSRTWLR
jgi:Asp-tRNA(Asn)/Glu-tRNA(Gln) amidotransferase A subunit family amidase